MAKVRERISEERRELLSALAAEVVAEHCTSLPIQPEDIIRAIGLTMNYGCYGDAFDGMLEWRSGRFHVFCNLDRVEHRTSPRARFTLCHELAHFYIDEHRHALEAGKSPAHPSQTEYKSRLPVEQEADFFAGRLLMPEAEFRVSARNTPRGLGGIMLLSERFQSSLSSTAIRYAELDLVPCTVIKWNSDGFGWKWLSTDTFRARYRRTIERIADLPRDSATAQALRGGPSPTRGFFQTGSTAAAWFPWISDDSFRNALIIEQAVSLGRFGALTFLFPDGGSY